MNMITPLNNKKFFLSLSIIAVCVFLLAQNVSKDQDDGHSESLPVSSSKLLPLNNSSVSDKKSLFVSNVSGNPESFKSSADILKLKMFKLASVDGEITADENGMLVIDRSVRHWIDFYLSALGELTLAEIQQLMALEISSLPMPARQQAEQLLADYLSYKEALASYEEQFKQVGPADHLVNLQQRHEWQKRLRRQILSSEVVEAFWQLDELVDDYALAQLVVNNSNESDEEKARELKNLEDALPAELKVFKRDLYIASDLQEKVVQSRQEGGSTEAVRQLRIEQVGPEAADRLEILEAKQEAWQQRILAYAREVESVAAIEGLTEQDKQERIRIYQQAHFNIKEQLRLDTALMLLRDE
ncbi:MAG: lipase chaperone LimK [Oleispira sp.]|jgi:lipase chaperone LimK